MVKVKTKIGFPKALLQYHKYNTLFKTFFEQLGIEVVYSDDTNKKIVEESLTIAEDEVCFGCKLIYGSSLNLKGKCDKVFIARLVSLTKDTFTCPRFMILPELVKLQTGLEVLNICINRRKYPLLPSFIALGLKLGKTPIRTIRAYNKALTKYNKEIKEIKQKRDKMLKEDKLKIALIGHPYLLYDKYINLNIFDRLKDTNIFTPKMADDVENIPDTYWSEEKELLNAAYYFMDNVDGIILLTSFLCGTGSLMNEFTISKAKECKVPLIQLILDENVTETMLDTRISAFINMIKRKCNT